VFPILLLFALLFVLGRMHIDLANGFTAPRVVTDGAEAVVFYDEGAHDSAFYFRRTRDAVDFDRKRRVAGVLAGACITSDVLVTLNGDTADPESKLFYSVFKRGERLQRHWSGTFSDQDLRLDHPCHVASLGDQVFVFATDTTGDLRVASLSPDDNLIPLDAVLPGAGVPPEADDSAASRLLKPRMLLHDVASATVDGALLLAWRVPKQTGGDPTGPGQVRWTRFDGDGFSPMQTLGEDLRALTVVHAPAVLDGAPPVTVMGVVHGDAEDVIRLFTPDAQGTLTEAGQVRYEHEGLTRSSGIAALSAGVVGERVLLLAQVGGVIRYTTWHEGSWSEWKDLAKIPAEQRAVVYGWFLSLLLLSGILIVQGWRGCRARRQRRQARARRAPTSLEAFCTPALPSASDEPSSTPTTPVTPPGDDREVGAPAPAAPLVERLVAFTVDAVLISLVCSLVMAFLPDVILRAEEDPRVRLALAAWFLIALVVYFSAFEALFARTPGKLLLGLEVQRLDGGRPGLASCLYRNLFRIELVLPPPYLVAPLSFLVMLMSDHHQRPGDLLASTCVRRTTQPLEVSA
jgi:uncharacterized RDD family membrane protein YckC